MAFRVFVSRCASVSTVSCPAGTFTLVTDIVMAASQGDSLVEMGENVERGGKGKVVGEDCK